MCGITGFSGLGSRDDLERMTKRLAHRGPDGDGLYEDPDTGVYLGHRRLAILDIPDGAQPMWTPDGMTGVVYNGEIYNHAELRHELTALGCQFQTDHSDTEVLLHAYLKWGQDMTHRLNGMWAFVIYDRHRQRLFGSRDRFGQKPFYYAHQTGFFAFASELSALKQHAHVSTQQNTTALIKYFAYGYIPTPHALYQNTYKLRAGHNLVWDVREQRLEVKQWWQFRIEPFDHVPKNAETEWGQHFLDLLQAAVKRRLLADVPVGVFLSGGLDSSTIAALAAKEIGPQRTRTFAIGFDESSFDESQFAQTAAQHIGCEHLSETVTWRDGQSQIETMLEQLDEPMGDSSLLPTWRLCGFARRHVTVALGGDGADELFAGYDPFHALQLANLYQKIVPRPVHAAISMLVNTLPVSHKNMSLDFKLKRTLGGLGQGNATQLPLWMAPLNLDQLSDLFGQKLQAEDVFSEAIEIWESAHTHHPVDKTLEFFTRLYLQNGILAKIDRAGMMHGLEARSPFLDIELVDFIRRVPHTFKYRKRTTKYLFKQAAASILPDNIIHRSKKGFGLPVGQWFRDGSLPMPQPQNTALKNDFIKNCIQQHQKGKQDHRLFLWCMKVLNRF